MSIVHAETIINDKFKRQKERENKLLVTTIEKIFSDDTPNTCPNEKHELLQKS